MGIAAAGLRLVPLPLLGAELPPLILVGAPLMLAFARFGPHAGFVATAVALVSAFAGERAGLLAALLPLVEALAAAFLRRRTHSLISGVVFYWCVLGWPVEALAWTQLLQLDWRALPTLLLARFFSGVLSALLTEAALRLFWSSDQPLPLRRVLLGQSAWLVTAPMLLLALLAIRVGYERERSDDRQRASQGAELAALHTSLWFEARGRELDLLARELEAANGPAAGRAGDAGLRGRIAAFAERHPEFSRLGVVDASGSPLASVATESGQSLPPHRLDEETEAADAVSWRPLFGAGMQPTVQAVAGLELAGRGARLYATLGLSVLPDLLSQQRRDPADVLLLVDARRRIVASSPTATAAALSDVPVPEGTHTTTRAGLAHEYRQDLRAATHASVGATGFGLVIDQPLATARKRVGRLLLAVLAPLAGALLLPFWLLGLARRVTAPLRRVDEVAHDLEGGQSGEVLAWSELKQERIEELRGLGASLARMHDALAHHDPLTGLPNRKHLVDRLALAAAQARGGREMFALMLVDLDRFRAIDSSVGHATGNALLRRIGARLEECVRSGDTVARVGGDEFALLLPRLGRLEEASAMAQKAMDAIKRPFVVGGREVFVTASIGISLYPRDGEDPETLLKNAFAATYVAKEKGQDSYRQYTARIAMRDARRLIIESGLRRALEQDGLVMLYQPVVDLKHGTVIGLEALVAWDPPGEARVRAADFIAVAESSGLIIAIDTWVVRAACRQARAWSDRGLRTRVAVNLSARQFQQPDLVDQITFALEQAGLPAGVLEIEITETAAMQDVDRCVETLRRLRDCGVSVAVDDFGTGYSSLNYLKRLPVDKVKLDQSFVRDITRSPDDAAIARAVVALAHSLKLGVVAEGVETEEQAVFLRGLGCDAMQGYLFSAPLPAEELEALLREGRRLSILLEAGTA